jgi:hypothetical protein
MMGARQCVGTSADWAVIERRIMVATIIGDHDDGTEEFGKSGCE